MRYKVIAIEREYASGGSEIGEKLAAKLGVPCYGQEILEKAAAKLNLPPERLAHAEENITGSLLYSMTIFSYITSGDTNDLLSPEQKLALTEANIIRELAFNPCVIIGRGAAAVLKENASTLSVFVHSDYKTRMDRAINLYGIDPEKAESVLHRFDKRRANYFKATTNSKWKDSDIYHLCLNSGKLGIEQTVDLLYKAALKEPQL